MSCLCRKAGKHSHRARVGIFIQFFFFFVILYYKYEMSLVLIMYTLFTDGLDLYHCLHDY